LSIMVLWSPVKKSLLELPESGLRFYSSSILIIYEGAPALEQAGLLGTEENSTDCQQFLSSDSDLPAYKEQSTTLSFYNYFQ